MVQGKRLFDDSIENVGLELADMQPARETLILVYGLVHAGRHRSPRWPGSPRTADGQSVVPLHGLRIITDVM
jgi:hypothetical protein